MYIIKGKKLKIIYQTEVDSQLPESLPLSLPDKYENVYILILSKAYKKYPTFRRTTRYK